MLRRKNSLTATVDDSYFSGTQNIGAIVGSLGDNAVVDNCVSYALSDEKRMMKYERFISSKIPCVIFSTMTKPSQDMIDMAIKYNVPTFVTERTTSSLMA